MTKETKKTYKGRVKGTKNVSKELKAKIRDTWRLGIYNNYTIAEMFDVTPPTVRRCADGWNKDMKEVIAAMAEGQAALQELALSEEAMEDILPVVGQNARDLNTVHRYARLIMEDSMKNKPSDASPADAEKLMRMLKDFKDIVSVGNGDTQKALIQINNQTTEDGEKTTILVLPSDEYEEEIKVIAKSEDKEEKIVEGEII